MSINDPGDMALVEPPSMEGSGASISSTPSSSQSTLGQPPYGGSGESTTDDKGAVARREASNVASTAGESAKAVAQEASTQVKNVAQQAKTQLTGLMGQTKDEVRQQAQAKGEQAAGGLRTLSQQLEALANGRPEEAGQLTSYLDDARQRVMGFASSLEQRGPQGLLEDIARYARRKPGSFLLMAGAAGFFAGRLVRAGAAASHENGDGAQRYGSSYTTQFSGSTQGQLQQPNAWDAPDTRLDVDVPARF